MRKKLIGAILLLVFIATAVTLVFVSARLYDTLEQRAFGEMKNLAATISKAMVRDDDPLALLEDLRQDVAHVRVSLIDASGKVLYDSSVADPDAMENHETREEVVQALATGEGSASRLSTSLGEKNYYYAIRLSDGSVLRLAQAQRSVWGEMMGVLPSLLLIALLVMGVSVVFADRITQHVLAPLERLDLDHPEENDTYEELGPLLKRLSQQRRQIDAQLRESEESARQATAILDNMAEGLLILSADGTIVSMNRSAEGMLSTPDMPYKGRHYSALLRDLSAQDAIAQAIQSRAVAEDRISIHGRTYHALISPVLLEGTLTGAIMLLLDSTERDAAEKSRKEFSANVSHELKTPLTTIMGYAEMIGMGLADDKDSRMLGERIRTEAVHLVALIEDIIALSRLDEMAAPVEAKPVDLHALAQTVVERMTPFAAGQRITLELQGTSCFIEGSPILLEEMMRNLVDNAIRYNVPGGKVEMRVWQDGEGAHVCVTDTGFGIEQSHHDRIFERFYRVDKSHSRETGGTGLGLSIVKHCVQIHGGEIALESEPGQGTSISIRF